MRRSPYFRSGQRRAAHGYGGRGGENGPPSAPESYLVIENIIAAYKAMGAEAVHPGYGFLSEQAAFGARPKKPTPIAFIGPNIKAIEAMGDKIESKRHGQSAGVAMVPGFPASITTRQWWKRSPRPSAIRDDQGRRRRRQRDAYRRVGRGDSRRLARAASEPKARLAMAASSSKKSTWVRVTSKSRSRR